MDDFKPQFDKAIQEYARKNAFDVSLIPMHSHNGADTLRVDFTNLVNKKGTGSVTIQGTGASVSTNYSIFFIAPYVMRITAITEVHVTAGTDAGTVSLNIEKLTGTQAPGTGTNLLTGTVGAGIFNLKGAINTIQTGTLVQAVSQADPRNLAINDRLAFVLSGTPTSVQNVTVSVVFGF